MPARWAGEFDSYYTPAELRAFGLRWSEIERDAMNNRVKWDDRSN